MTRFPEMEPASLSRECAVGRLISLVMPLAPELRAYDVSEELFPVMAIVHNCYPTTVDDQTVYHVGVGFIGKRIPASFKNNPRQRYLINGMGKDGLWQVAEADSQFKARRNPRFWVPTEVTLTIIHGDAKTNDRETAITRNISAGGISVPCSLETNVGGKVKVAFKEYDFYAIAVVRNREESKGQIPTLHLEFVDEKFPIEKIVLARTGAAAVYWPAPSICNSLF